jgi:hypothetical protein
MPIKVFFLARDFVSVCLKGQSHKKIEIMLNAAALISLRFM